MSRSAFVSKHFLRSSLQTETHVDRSTMDHFYVHESESESERERERESARAR